MNVSAKVTVPKPVTTLTVAKSGAPGPPGPAGEPGPMGPPGPQGEPGEGAGIPVDGTYPTATTDVLRSKVTGDTTTRYELEADGRHWWGAGGTTAPDIQMFRQNGRLKVDKRVAESGDSVAVWSVTCNLMSGHSSTAFEGLPFATTANLANVTGFRSLPQNNGTAAITVTNVMGFHAATPTGAGLITNCYGLRVAAQKTANVTNAYGVVQEGTADTNTFAGPTTFYGPVTFTPSSTGWAVTPGYTADKTFNPEATTVTELARALGTLIDELKARGLLGG
jgi:hypothetical protein